MVYSKTERFGPLTGIAAVLLWIVGAVVMFALPTGIADNATDAQTLAWIKHNANDVLAGGWIFMVGACVVLSSQLQQGPPQTWPLGTGDLAGLQVDQSPAAVSYQAGCTHLRVLDPGAEHGLDRVAEYRFNCGHAVHGPVTRLRPATGSHRPPEP